MSHLVSFSTITKLVEEIKEIESEISRVKEAWPTNKNSVIKIILDPDNEEIVTEVRAHDIVSAMLIRRTELCEALSKLGVTLD